MMEPEVFASVVIGTLATVLWVAALPPTRPVLRWGGALVVGVGVTIALRYLIDYVCGAC